MYCTLQNSSNILNYFNLMKFETFCERKLSIASRPILSAVLISPFASPFVRWGRVEPLGCSTRNRCIRRRSTPLEDLARSALWCRAWSLYRSSRESEAEKSEFSGITFSRKERLPSLPPSLPIPQWLLSLEDLGNCFFTMDRIHLN